MLSPTTLASLADGQSACITELHLEGIMRRRLLDLGFTAGAHITCLQHSASGDPAAYLIRGTVIALRQEDSSRIAVLDI